MSVFGKYFEEVRFESLREQCADKKAEQVATDNVQSNKIKALEERLSALEGIVFKAETEKMLIEIDNMKEGEEKSVSLLSNVDLVEKSISVKSKTNVTIDLNNKEINAQAPNLDAILVEDGATLTINGNGLVSAANGGNGYPIITNGKLIINGGKFISGYDKDHLANACIYARGNGDIEIHGGRFETFDGTFVLNKKDSDRATTSIKVYGGEFVNFDPSNNASEIPNENFVAEGCKVETFLEGDKTIYKVVKA